MAILETAALAAIGATNKVTSIASVPKTVVSKFCGRFAIAAICHRTVRRASYPAQLTMNWRAEGVPASIHRNDVQHTGRGPNAGTLCVLRWFLARPQWQAPWLQSCLFDAK